MRYLLCTLALIFAGCSSAIWPEAGKNPGGWQAIAQSDLSSLSSEPTAGEVIQKMGRPAGELPLTWYDYHAADRGEKSYYRFHFEHAKRTALRPSDRLVSIEVVSSGVTATEIIWPLPRKEANQVPEPTSGLAPGRGSS